MNKIFEEQLIGIAKKKISKEDPAHDIEHALRVLAISKKIAIAESADFDIIIPSAIFHDIICYPKNHSKRLRSAKESAEYAKKILMEIKFFPKSKIRKVYKSINFCSFTKAKKPDFLEARILQDADSLEATGAISIMRTFSSAGIMGKIFYASADPFCQIRKPDDSEYALDLFFTRLLVVQNRLHTQTAKIMVKKRVMFLKDFLKALQFELLDNTNA